MYVCAWRYDVKNFGCLWDRTHPSPYLFIIFAAVVALPTVTILICYYKIFAYVKPCKAMVWCGQTNLKKNFNKILCLEIIALPSSIKIVSKLYSFTCQLKFTVGNKIMKFFLNKFLMLYLLLHEWFAKFQQLKKEF